MSLLLSYILLSDAESYGRIATRLLIVSCGWIDWGPLRDPASPKVYIPPPPPDLNCADIEHRDSEVL